MEKQTRRLALVAAAVIVIGAAGAGTALADTTTPTPSAGSSTGTSTSPQPHRPRHPGLHGEFTVQTRSGPQTRDYQRGTVTADSGGAVTVRSRDGFTATYTTDASTRVRKNRAPSQVDQVAQGDSVGVVAVRNGSTVEARRIVDRPAAG